MRYFRVRSRKLLAYGRQRDDVTVRSGRSRIQLLRKLLRPVQVYHETATRDYSTSGFRSEEQQCEPTLVASESCDARRLTQCS